MLIGEFDADIDIQDKVRAIARLLQLMVGYVVDVADSRRRCIWVAAFVTIVSMICCYC